MSVKQPIGSANNVKEFGNLSKWAYNLRNEFYMGILHCYDTKVQPRLIKGFSKVIMHDHVSKRGNRNPGFGDYKVLEGFAWNEKTGLKDVLKAPFIVAANRSQGTVTINIPSFIPKEMMTPDPMATHFRITFSTLAFNYDANDHPAEIRFTEWIPFNDNPTKEILAIMELDILQSLPIITSLAITWAKEENGRMKGLNNLEYNTAEIVDVNVKERASLRRIFPDRKAWLNSVMEEISQERHQLSLEFNDEKMKTKDLPTERTPQS